MITLSISRRVICALALVIVTAFLVGASALPPRINVSLSGTVARDGRQIRLEDAGKVFPNEVISWNIAATNTSPIPANAISVVGDIDDGTAFISGSASGNGIVSVKYSVEHPHENQTFYEHPMVRVGRTQRPATPDEFKAIQLTFASIGAGETLRASYRTRVR